MQDIQTLLDVETQSISYYNEIGADTISNLLNKLSPNQCPTNPPPNILGLINHYKNDLKNLRFGNINTTTMSNVLGVLPEPSTIINERIEFAGHIDIETGECMVSASGTNGMINDFILSPDKINFHTHPPYNGKWPFAPPSEIDIAYLITQQQLESKTIYNAVSTREGIYIYYLHPNFDKTINIEYFKEDYQTLKNDLGYSSSGTRLFGVGGAYDSPIKTLTRDNILLQSGLKSPIININTFLNTVNSKGICTHLIPYDELGGGSRTYPISYSL